MRFTSEREKLAEAIGVVQKVVSARSPLPVLSGILFEARGSSLILTGSDMDLTIQYAVDVEVEEEGAVVLPVRYIASLIRHLPDVPVHFHTLPESASTVITYGASQLSIHGFEAEQYPVLPQITGSVRFSLPQDLLKAALRQVLFAVSSDDARPIFTGVLWQLRPGELRLVATDTFRLALRRLNLREEPSRELDLIVPGKALGEVARLAGDEEEGEVEVVCGDNHIFFLMGGVKIYSRLIAGQFPMYEQVIPREFVTRARLITREVMEATERASLLAKDNLPVIQFTIQEKRCIISVQTQAGWIREEVEAQAAGEPMEVWFNARFISEGLKALGSEEAELSLTGPLSAAVLRPPGDESYLSLLLPAKPPREEWEE